jgi:uncharacterized protein YqeY
MTTPRETIESDLKSAMKARDKEKVSTLRLLLADLKNESIRRRDEVDEAGFLGLVQKAIRQRQEAAEQYRRGGSEERAAAEEREAELLAAYLPEQVDESEIRAAIEDLVRREDLSGPAAMGTVMKTMMVQFAGRADGAIVNRIARQVLAGSS